MTVTDSVLSIGEQKKRVTLIGAAVNLLLAVVKIAVGKMAASHALVADGIHSLSDLLTDLLVWFATHYGSQAVDEDHPYGHARFETVATVVLGGLLIVVGVGIGWDAVSRITGPEIVLKPSAIALFAALFSILANEGLFRYTLRVAKETRSRLLEANAWHHRSDSISSVIVFVGIGGSLVGVEVLDDFAAIAVAIMVAKIGYDLLKESLSELVDTSLPKERLEEIRAAIRDVDGVASLHFLRTRRMGGEALVDVHIQVDSEITVSEGHLISDTVKYRLLNRFEEVSDVLVHVDPEDDEEIALNASLPLRKELEGRIQAVWSGVEAASRLKKINLHYLQGKVIVEVILPLALLSEGLTVEEIESQLKIVEEQLDEVAEVVIYFSR
ncbi:MAG: cation transporter [Gammaproteobacteria bacterium]|nr:MAG: cation transporter [Gammaproteobacteria bacterium]